METKKRTVEKRRKEAETEQLEQEVARMENEKSTKEKVRSGSALKNLLEFSYGVSQFSSGSRKEGRMEHLPAEVARMEHLPEWSSWSKKKPKLSSWNGKKLKLSNCQLMGNDERFRSSTWETEVLFDLSNIRICTLLHMFDLVSMPLFGIKAVLEQDMAKAETVGTDEILMGVAN